MRAGLLHPPAVGTTRAGRVGARQLDQLAHRFLRFGGILRCDVLATGVVAAAKDLQLKVPVVVRMEGTNVELGQQILRDSGLNFTIANDMKDGAQKVVALAGGAR